MHEGRCSKVQLQAWALNRYYYQASIPIKDSTILSRIEDPALRRIWRQRIIDHDGEHEADGGVYRWIKLAEGLGLDRELVVGARAILPITRYAVEAYIHFCATRTLLEAIASSLTELFSPNIIGERVSGMLANYDFVTKDTLAYFTARPVQAQRDSDFAIHWVKAHALTAEQQQAALRALEFKCDVLWAQSDALMHAYVEGHPPPGAWRGEGA
jgi:coenzyme PQQ biosynthesis protein C